MGTVNWHERAERADLPNQLFIDGKFVDAADGGTFEKYSPIDGRLQGVVASGQAADIDAAVLAARQAFEDGRWSGLDPAVRKAHLLRFAEEIERAAERLALAETLDVGKPIANTLAVDAPGTANTIRWYAEAIDKTYDEIAPAPAKRLALITREPLGVVGAVVPWNYPSMIASWKIGPALAAGNTFVLKPAEQSPHSALVLAEAAQRAGLPDGVLNVVTGFGETAGQALGRHLDVDKIAFTGSTRVGRLFQQYAAESNGKQVAIEAGGKSPQLVLDSAGDLQRIAETVAWGIYYNVGQTCNAGSRLIVHESLADELVTRITEFAARTFVPGDPLDENTQFGAIADEQQLASVTGYLEQGRRTARLVTGGNRVRTESGGYYVQPTIFAEVDNDSVLAQEEIFGPVLTVTTFTTEEQGVALANDTRYGLAASVWTTDLSAAHRVSRQLRAGTVWVNTFDESSVITPFGGFKETGLGRDKSLHALDAYTALKTTWINWE
ncbi:acyl-CoA reductase-like NAD-dependent aldehyde dehydrogenase [Nocardia sp. GAS34]|uniref:aldehyde dehydrogenase n=1 Tax=unclassified Nocardia TaxID=2637762 RepID=UPI003D221736